MCHRAVRCLVVALVAAVAEAQTIRADDDASVLLQMGFNSTSEELAGLRSEVRSLRREIEELSSVQNPELNAASCVYCESCGHFYQNEGGYVQMEEGMLAEHYGPECKGNKLDKMKENEVLRLCCFFR